MDAHAPAIFKAVNNVVIIFSHNKTWQTFLSGSISGATIKNYGSWQTILVGFFSSVPLSIAKRKRGNLNIHKAECRFHDTFSDTQHMYYCKKCAS